VERVDYVPDVTSGIGSGADLFLDFIEHELNPLFQKSPETSVDPNDCTIIGHSYGGLFATWALLTRPGVFNRYISISPSLFRIKAQFNLLIDNFDPQGNQKHYYSIAGELEHPNHKVKMLERMVRNNHPWVDLVEEEREAHTRAGIEGPIDIPKDLLEFDALFGLKRNPLLNKHCEILANESHNTIVSEALSRGLRHVFDSTSM
jgi:pimeloyl-ACP methyl ester carboxylesterase